MLRINQSRSKHQIVVASSWFYYLPTETSTVCMALQTMHRLIAQNFVAIHPVPLNVVIVWSLHISIK